MHINLMALLNDLLYVKAFWRNKGDHYLSFLLPACVFCCCFFYKCWLVYGVL